MSDNNINERVAKLEARQEIAERLAATFSAESAADRKALHQAIDHLSVTLQEWKNSQRGYLAGVTSVVALIAWAVTMGWEWIVRHVAK